MSEVLEKVEEVKEVDLVEFEHKRREEWIRYKDKPLKNRVLGIEQVLEDRYYIRSDNKFKVHLEKCEVCSKGQITMQEMEQKKYMKNDNPLLFCKDFWIPTQDSYFKDTFFGWEFETCSSEYGTERNQKQLDIRNEIEVTSDGSLTGTRPVEFLQRGPLTFEESISLFKDVRDVLNTAVNSSCGLHIHVSNACEDRYKFSSNLVTLATLIESRLFKLMPDSRMNNRYCRTFRDTFGEAMKMTSIKMGRSLLKEIHPNKGSNSYRYCWLNLVELFRSGGKGTVEFRLLGNTQRIMYLAPVMFLWGTLMKQAENINIEDKYELERFLETVEPILQCIEYGKNSNNFKVAEFFEKVYHGDDKNKDFLEMIKGENN